MLTACLPEHWTKPAAPIHEHVTLATEEAVLGVGQVPGELIRSIADLFLNDQTQSTEFGPQGGPRNA
jgi:hypothetical protein